MKKLKRIPSILLSIVMILNILPMSAMAATGDIYADVKTSDWFYDAVKYVSDIGLMNGTDSNKFSPNDNVTRGMIVTILYRLENAPAMETSCPFSDVQSGSWYEKAITWAATNQIVNGISPTTFSADSNLTREQMVTILYRYAALKNYDVEDIVSLEAFEDASEVGAWAETAMKWAVGQHIIIKSPLARC